MNRSPAPFRVFRSGQMWFIRTTHLPRTLPQGFDTQADAITYVYRHWPWWP